jgi:RNA polymerase sigma factor (sigma-70 family)
MATGPTSEVIQHLRRTVLLRDGADLTDAQLLGQFVVSRDEAALAALVRRHGPMVWGVCRRLLRSYHDAEDAFQATFLVLVRKAASIASRELLANWLYGVARQTALKARATAARRKGRERQVTQMPEPAAVEQDSWSDLQPLLDEELGRLPDRYRSVIVLCDLQGKTRKAAAQQLGVPEGTVAGQLARAREMLAKRLAQRDVALSGGALAAVLARNVASAGVPPSVVSSTIKAATLLAAGQAAGVVSARVAALTEGALKSMFLTKLKSAMAVALAVAAIVGIGAELLSRATADGQNQGRKDEAAVPDTARKGGGQEAQAAQVIETTAHKVVLAYIHNDARGDEAFLGKKLRVSGRLLRVKRVGKGDTAHYLLTLYADPSDARFGEMLVMSDKMALAFLFPTDAQKQLARLEGGQRVTIEGLCEGRTVEGRDAITFTGCKVVKVRE